MVKVLKAGKSQEEVNANDLKVSKIVSEASKDVEERGDKQFVNYLRSLISGHQNHSA